MDEGLPHGLCRLARPLHESRAARLVCRSQDLRGAQHVVQLARDFGDKLLAIVRPQITGNTASSRYTPWKSAAGAVATVVAFLSRIATNHFHGAHLVVRGARDLHVHTQERDPPPADGHTQGRRLHEEDGADQIRERARLARAATYDLNIYADLLDLILNMSILNLDIFVVSFDMFLLSCYQSALNFGQFDLIFGQIIYSYSGQFACTATTASSSSSHNFLCRLQSRSRVRQNSRAISMFPTFSRARS